MSFSHYAVIAEGLQKKKQAGPSLAGWAGAMLAAMHGRTGCSGCTPAEPYPPSRRATVSVSKMMGKNNEQSSKPLT